jgi:hypothetical protein
VDSVYASGAGPRGISLQLRSAAVTLERPGVLTEARMTHTSGCAWCPGYAGELAASFERRLSLTSRVRPTSTRDGLCSNDQPLDRPYHSNVLGLARSSFAPPDTQEIVTCRDQQFERSVGFGQELIGGRTGRPFRAGQELHQALPWLLEDSAHRVAVDAQPVRPPVLVPRRRMTDQQVDTGAAALTSELVRTERFIAGHLPEVQRHHLHAHVQLLRVAVANPDDNSCVRVWQEDAFEDVLGHAAFAKCHGLLRVALHPVHVLVINIERDDREIKTQRGTQQCSSLRLESKPVCCWSYAPRPTGFIFAFLVICLERQVRYSGCAQGHQGACTEGAVLRIVVLLPEDDDTSRGDRLRENSSSVVWAHLQAAGAWRLGCLGQREPQLFGQRLQPSRSFQLSASSSQRVRIREATHRLQQIRQRVVANRLAVIDGCANKRDGAQVVARCEGTPPVRLKRPGMRSDAIPFAPRGHTATMPCVRRPSLWPALGRIQGGPADSRGYGGALGLFRKTRLKRPVK